MRIQKYSIRAILGLIIGFMGILALLLALVGGEIHQSHAYNNHRLSMQKLIKLKAEDLLTELALKSSDLTFGLYKAPEFHQAFSGREVEKLKELMRNQFHDFYVTTEILKLEALTVLEPDLTVIAEIRTNLLNFPCFPQFAHL